MKQEGIACSMFMRNGSRKKWERNRVPFSSYKFAKEEFGQERYVKRFVSKREIRLGSMLWMVSAGLLGELCDEGNNCGKHCAFIVLWDACT